MSRTALTALAILSAMPVIARAETAAHSLDAPAYHGTVASRSDGDRTVIKIEGVITPAVAERFTSSLESAAGSRRVVIDLDSPGGFTKDGYAMIDAILHHRKAGHRIETLVRGDAMCESMCVGIFMAGSPRRAEPGASFMVHAPRSAGTGTLSMRAIAAMKKRLLSLGVARSWLDRAAAAGAFSGSVDYRRKAETLVQDGANIVTHLVADAEKRGHLTLARHTGS